MANEVEKGITVKFGAETAEFQNGMTDVNNELKNSTKALKNSQKVLRIVGKDVDTLADHQKALAKQYALTEVKLDDYNKQLKEMGDYNELTSTKERNRYKQLERLINDSVTELKLLEKQAEQTDKELQSLKDVNISIAADNQADKTISDAESSLKTIDGMKAEAKITADASELTKAIDDAKGELEGIAGAAVGLAGGQELSEGLANAVDSGLTKGFSQGKTATNIAGYTDDTRDEILGYLKGELGFSEKVSEQIIAQASAYSNNSKELVKYSKTLGNAATLGAIKEGEPLNAGETFKTYADQVRDFVEAGSLTVFEDTEISTVDGLNAITKAGALTQEQLAQVAEEVTDMDKFETAFKFLDDTQRLEILNDLMQKNYSTAAESLDTGTSALWAAAGATTQIQDTISGAFENIAVLLAPIVILLGKFTEVFPNISKGIVTIGILASVLLVILSVVGGIITLLAPLAGFFSAISGAIGALVSAIGALVAAIGWPITLIIALIALLWVFRDQVVKVLLFIWNYIKQFFTWLSSAIPALIQNISMMLKQFGISLFAFIQSIPERIKSALEAVKNAFTSTFTNIKNLIISTIGSAIDWAISKIKSLLNVIGSIKSKVSSAVSGVLGIGRKTQNIQTINNNSNETQILVQKGNRTRKATLFEAVKQLKGLA